MFLTLFFKYSCLAMAGGFVNLKGGGSLSFELSSHSFNLRYNS